MEPNLSVIIDQIGKDKGLDRRVIIEALEAAMLTAARKKFGLRRDLEAHFNNQSGEIEVFEFKTVMEKVEDPLVQIALDEAQKVDPEAQLGDTLGFKIPTSNFGRIAAQTAKQVIIQRVRDAERDMIYTEYKDRVGELVTGIARRFEKGNIIIDLGRAEAVLPIREQAPRETYRPGDRVMAYVVKVDKEMKGSIIMLSRVHPGLLIKLFEMEVPEIAEGIVRIESAAREPGGRAKVAVSSRDTDVDPVGACVGMKGSRVQAVVQELRGEKIDIVPYHDDPARFVCNALAPAEVSRVLIDEANHGMEIIVPDDQLSLAIGRRGQNVRLAAQLSGWKLEIHSETRMAEIRNRALRCLQLIDGMTETMAQLFYEHGFKSCAEIAESSAEELGQVPGISEGSGEKIMANVKPAIEEERKLIIEMDRLKAEAEAQRQAEERRRLAEVQQAAAAAAAQAAAEKAAAAAQAAAAAEQAAATEETTSAAKDGPADEVKEEGGPALT